MVIGLQTFVGSILIWKSCQGDSFKRNSTDHRWSPYGSGGASKDRDGDTSFQWSQFTTQCSHLMFPSKDIMTTE
ncbi:hypothetical protein Tco_0654332 [Tanacetum coccineum]|uniref:Uncharacterized protein n=1 Tax=Tanacetum coccineum TaxID=301880 RepID=A0ABQ4X2W3_9ASTR